MVYKILIKIPNAGMDFFFPRIFFVSLRADRFIGQVNPVINPAVGGEPTNLIICYLISHYWGFHLQPEELTLAALNPCFYLIPPPIKYIAFSGLPLPELHNVLEINK